MSDRKRKMPKIDLHCHLDGSLSRACIGEILGRTVEPAELQAGMECKVWPSIWKSLIFL